MESESVIASATDQNTITTPGDGALCIALKAAEIDLDAAGGGRAVHGHAFPVVAQVAGNADVFSFGSGGNADDILAEAGVQSDVGVIDILQGNRVNLDAAGHVDVVVAAVNRDCIPSQMTSSDAPPFA